MLPIATIASRILTAPLTSFPRTLEKLVQLIEDGNSPTGVVTAVLASDPMLTAAVLGRANVIATIPITRLSQAVLNLGLGAIEELCREALPMPAGARRALASCWGMANAVSTMTGIIVAQAHRWERKPDSETAHLAGLIHDLGTILAMQHFVPEYARASLLAQTEQVPFRVLLKEELGADAGEVGAIAAKAWGLPDPLATAMRLHQSPLEADEDHRPLACAIHIARVLVRCAGFSATGDEYVEPLDPKALEEIGLRDTDLEPLLEHFYDEQAELELYEGVLAK